MTNIPDSQYMAKILFREWKPEAYVDHHHMGGNGARIYPAAVCRTRAARAPTRSSGAS